MILGTAGHVDHGKTALVKALTGVNTDRLAEERRRGLSIELGFAPLPLPGGGQLGVVDVPGHEQFIPTMLSGCEGMDLVLLAVAADEGPMPQTREHLAILSLLGIRHAVVALTRADLADEARRTQSIQAVRALAAGTFLEGAPILPVSVRTGEGLEELRQAIFRLAASLPQPPGDGPFRLHVHQVFSVEGSGTVVTGTLTGGTLAVGDTVQLYPGTLTPRVRGLQCHGQSVDSLPPGSRAAVNLARVRLREVHRGDTLALPGSLSLTQRADVALTLLPQAPYAVKNNCQLHFHHGGRSLVCRCILLGRDVLEPGETGCAQLRFAQPIAARPGDRFVVRFFSPLATLGGGVLLDLEPPAKGRMRPERLAALAAGKGPAPAAPAPPEPVVPTPSVQAEGELEALYRDFGLEPPLFAQVEAQFPGRVKEARRALRRLLERGELLLLEPGRPVHAGRCKQAEAALRAAFGAAPFTLAQARDGLGISRKYALLLLELWDSRGISVKTGDARTFR